MRHPDQWQIVDTAASSLCSRQQKKSVCNDGRCRHPAVFELYRVVDTPRRARASIGEGIDDEVTIIAQFRQAIGLGPAHFTLSEKFDMILVPQQRAQVTEKMVR